MKKKIVSLFLALSLAFSLSVPALAATPEEAQDDAELLYNLGLFLGSSTNPDGTPVQIEEPNLITAADVSSLPPTGTLSMP